MSINAFPVTPALVKALEEEGLLPAECGDITIVFPVQGIVDIKYSCHLDLKAFTRALVKSLIATGNDPFAEDP